jgi:hypothetical protein
MYASILGELRRSCTKSQPNTPRLRAPRSRLMLADAAEWLDIAASVDCVQLTTARYDESIMWCRGAAEFEDRRSAALSECVGLLTIFSFAWSAIEVLAQVVQWSDVPKHCQAGSNKPSAIERMTYALHAAVPIRGYDIALAHLRKELQVAPLIAPRKAKALVGPAGEALDVIRTLSEYLCPWRAPHAGWATVTPVAERRDIRRSCCVGIHSSPALVAANALDRAVW